MRGVCRRAGLTTRYFYENFGTRDELLDLLYRQVCAEFLDAARAGTASPQPEQWLTMLLVDKVLEDPRKAKLFLMEPYSGTVAGRVPRTAVPSFTRLIRDRFCADIRDPVRRDLVAVTVAGACAGLFSAWSSGTLCVTREQVADHITETLTACRRMLSVD